MGRGKGARCWVGRETPSAKHTPLPQPMLGQASPWAKLCILRLVGSGPARAPSGCREKDFGDWHDALPWGEGRDQCQEHHPFLGSWAGALGPALLLCS